MFVDTVSEDAGSAGLAARPETALSLPGSRAVIVGSGSHVASSRLPGLPAVAGTVSAVRDLLIRHCRMGTDQIRAVVDPADQSDFLSAAEDMARQAEDVLLVYYIGHGLVNLRGEFFLATNATTDRDAWLPVEALPFGTLRGVLSASRARHVVTVLDCCFSGRPAAASSAAVADAFELTSGRGSYLLSATSATEQALAPADEQYTVFSGELLKFMKDGVPNAPYELTLDHLYSHLSRTLPQRGAPAPQRRLAGDTGSLVVAPNPQAPGLSRPRPAARGEDPGQPCPYPGLGAFTEQETRYFHGREQLVDEVLHSLAAVGDDGPLAVVGRSGAGKSSLLQAGLLPAIRAGRLAVPGSRYWSQLIVTPGEHPLRALARRLAVGTGQDEESLAALLADDPRQLRRTLDAALRDGPSSQGVVLCVDQFEEVFTACADEAERAAFIQALCALAPERQATAPRMQVIIGLRADFYGHCLEYPSLAAVLSGRQVLMRSMRPDELRAAIERPARAAGLRLEEGLTGRILLDLESAEGTGRDAGSALPMLAFALQATWQLSDKRVLTLADYEATGGIWGAVTQRAEKLWASLGDGQDAAKILLLSMVQLGDGTDDVRRRADVADLLAGQPEAERAAIRRALDECVRARLVTVDADTAEIAHEALLRAWPRLRQWIEEDRQELLDRQRLAQAARFWKSGGGPLYTGARLEEARDWLKADPGRARRPLTGLEREFARASVRAERRRRNRRLSVVTAAVVAVLVLVAGGVYAVQQRAGNQRSQAEESSVALAQEADNLRATDPAGAMWLALTAYSSAKTAQARTELYKSLTTPYPVPLPGNGTGTVDSVAYSPDGKTAAAVWADGTVVTWDVSNPLRPVQTAALKTPAGGDDRLAFSPDGQLLAIHALGSLELWRIGTPAGQPVLVSRTPLASVPPRLDDRTWLPVAFSPDGRVVATGDADGRFRLWNVTDPAHPSVTATAMADGAGVNAVAFSPDGDTLAVASANGLNTGQGGKVRLWNVRDPARPALGAVLGVTSALAVAFSPVGHLLVAAGSDGDVYAWNVADVSRPAVALNSSGDGSGSVLASVAFRPHSDVFVTTDTSGKSEIYTDFPGVGISDDSAGDLPDPAGPSSAAFSPGGQEVLTGDRGGAVQLWTSLVPLLPGWVNEDDGGSPFSADGRDLVTSDPDAGNGETSAVRLWDVSDPLDPKQDAKLPGSWLSGAFLPGRDTLVTFAQAGLSTTLQLWDVSDPRHPRAAARLPDPGGSDSQAAIQETWSASGNGLLLIAHPHGVQVWDIRNVYHPVLDSTLPVNADGSVLLFGGQLAGVTVLGNPTQHEVKLWDLTNPRHPVPGGEVPYQSLAFTGIYAPGSHVLAAAVGQAGEGDDTGTEFWSLGNSRKPSVLLKDADMDPGTLNGLGDDTWVALTRGDSAIAVWDVSDPRRPAMLAALPYTTGSTGSIQTTASPGGWLAASGIPSGGSGGDALQLTQVQDGGRAISDYGQVPGDSIADTFSPGGKSLATNFQISQDSALTAFFPPASDTSEPGILYPMDADSLEDRLCSIAGHERVGSQWQRYLPATYYRPACS